MRGHHVVFDQGLQGRGHQGASRGDEAIDKHGEAVAGTPQNESGNAANFQPANGRQGPQRIVRARRIDLQGAFDDRHFMLPGRVVNARAIPRDLRHGHAGEQRHQGATWGGVGNPHVASGNQ